MAKGAKKSAKRYARMLFNLTGPERAEETISILTALADMIDENKEIKNFFYSPLIAEDERLKALEAVSEKLSLSEDLKKFIIYLSKVKGIDALRDILRHYTNLYYESQKKTRATVITPVKFNGAIEGRLLDALKRMTNREVELEYIYDPELLGGVVVKVGSTMYDSSLRGQLNMLREQLSK
ncbi:MAG: ATP synthase F1 subunit delta [Nitrospirae bacterium]|nr:MAG: ATP synthase F1 subunit delta [Nitrospirota bacterium]